jgi:hypothetical protein
MTSEIETRQFAIDDYEAAVELWKRVEGVEIAEGDDREGVAQFLARNPGLSRVATVERSTMEPAGAERHGRESPRGLMSREANQSIVGVAFCGIGAADWLNGWSTNVWRVCAGSAFNAPTSW